MGTCALPDTPLAEPRQAPQRLPYHLLALTTAGHGTVEVDFEPRTCRPGTLLWIRPGQAVHLGGRNGMNADMVAWRRDLFARLFRFPDSA